MLTRALLSLAFLWSVVAQAQSNCPPLDKGNVALTGGLCECGDSLSKYAGLKIPEYSLVAACFHEAYPKSALQGTFYYQGNKLFEGLLSQNAIDAGMVFQQGSTYFNLYEEYVPISQLEKLASHAPACNTAKRAKAKISVNLFKSVTGDSGQAGSFPLQYKLISIGQFLCPAEDLP